VEVGVRRLVLACGVALFCWCPPALAAGGRDKTAAELYELGVKHMQRGYYTKSLEELNRVRNYFRDDPISVKAELAIADVYFKKGDYEQARFAYESFATYHPKHESLDYVTWRTGQSIYKRASRFAGRDQTATRSAVSVWTSFEARFPDSEHASEVRRLLERARERLATKEYAVARFYARRDAWGAVAGRASGLVASYPDAERVPEALALWGEALHAWGASDDAGAVREQLAAMSGAERSLAQLDRALQQPPGERPVEEVFTRPYRVRAFSGPAAAAAAPSQPTR